MMDGGAVLVAPVDVAHDVAIVLLLMLQCPERLGDQKTLIDYIMIAQKLDAFADLALEESCEEGFQKGVEMGLKVLGLIVVDYYLGFE